MRLTAAIVAALAVLVGGIPRVLVAAGIGPEILRPFTWSDALSTYLRDGGRSPYWEVPYEYPPLTGYLAGLFSRVSADPATYVAL